MLSPCIFDFEIKELNIHSLPTELFTFMDIANAEGMKNNISINSMKFGKWKDEAWWVTWHRGQIISISGCHRFDEFEKDCWRLMVRTATLKKFRGRAPGSIKKIKNDFNWGHILQYQIKYAIDRNANKLVFTTNSDMQHGDINSIRTNRIVKKVLEPQGLVKLIAKDVDVFYTKQNVWEILAS